MEMIKTIPTLPVTNIDKAVTFYETKFGFTGPKTSSELIYLSILLKTQLTCSALFHFSITYLFICSATSNPYYVRVLSFV
jgi:hypothetical protein